MSNKTILRFSHLTFEPSPGYFSQHWLDLSKNIIKQVKGNKGLLIMRVTRIIKAHWMFVLCRCGSAGVIVPVSLLPCRSNTTKLQREGYAISTIKERSHTRAIIHLSKWKCSPRCSDCGRWVNFNVLWVLAGEFARRLSFHFRHIAEVELVSRHFFHTERYDTSIKSPPQGETEAHWARTLNQC